jgi:hypothetical protein
MYADIRMQQKVTRRIALTRVELAYLEAAAARTGIGLDAFLEAILRGWLAARDG